MTEMPPEIAALIDAGFTPGELQKLGEALLFAAQMGADFHESLHVQIDQSEWSDEKRAAWRAAIESVQAKLGPHKERPDGFA